jgi:hypothetical protein
MEQPLLTPLTLEVSITNKHGDKIRHYYEEMTDSNGHPIELQIMNNLDYICESIAHWLKLDRIEFETRIPPNDNDEYVVNYKNEDRKFPTETVVFADNLTNIRAGIIKGTPSITIRKSYAT